MGDDAGAVVSISAGDATIPGDCTVSAMVATGAIATGRDTTSTNGDPRFNRKWYEQYCNNARQEEQP